MERLPIRQEEPPDDAIVVVRAGVMAPDRIAATASDAFEDFGMYAVSVEVAINKSAAELCRTSPRIGARYGKVRLSTFGRLRASGFAVLPTFEHPHFDIVLADVSDVTVARLDRCFDEPIPNPVRVAPG
jgi:hypothetical protein